MSIGSVRLGRFELLSELGVGSFGYVFRAWDPQLQRGLDLLKAMKILDKGRPGPAGPQAQTR